MNRTTEAGSIIAIAIATFMIIMAAVFYNSFSSCENGPCKDAFELEHKRWCDMHQIWLDTDGQYGWPWPEYKGNFETQCSEDIK